METRRSLAPKQSLTVTTMVLAPGNSISVIPAKMTWTELTKTGPTVLVCAPEPSTEICRVAKGSSVTRLASTVNTLLTTIWPSCGEMSPIPGGCVEGQVGGGPWVPNSTSSTARLLLNM